MYDLLAPHYRSYAAEKARYIETVDHIILQSIPALAESMLDVGSGDGIRAINLAKQAGIKHLVLSEPSQNMVELCRQSFQGEVWNVTAENLPQTELRFDVATCLWNVLGHIPNTDSRIESLRRIHALLKASSLLCLDVNNRYNAYAYGGVEVGRRMLYDFFNPNNNEGDTEYELKVDGISIAGMGHLFTPQEMNGLVRAAGFRIKKRYAVDYKFGRVNSSVFQGQLLYILERKD